MEGLISYHIHNAQSQVIASRRTRLRLLSQTLKVCFEKNQRRQNIRTHALWLIGFQGQPLPTKNIAKGHLLQSDKYKVLPYLYKTGIWLGLTVHFINSKENIFIIVVWIDFSNSRSYPTRLMNKINLVFNKSIHVVLLNFIHQFYVSEIESDSLNTEDRDER